MDFEKDSDYLASTFESEPPPLVVEQPIRGIPGMKLEVIQSEQIGNFPKP